jgi:hypothetical protein
MCIQSDQRACDSWRSNFGSTALAVLNSFFASNEEYEEDEDRKEFARLALEHFAFLYHDTTSDNPKVSHPALLAIV